MRLKSGASNLLATGTLSDLLASERAMEMICSAMNSNNSGVQKIDRVNEIIDVWTHRPLTLISEEER
jgi:hypothetical protein